jgi:predicted HD phosphohydrolase
MDKVTFTRMADGTKEEYELLKVYGAAFTAGLADRIVSALSELDRDETGYCVSRLTHCLQTATRAHRDGRDEEYLVMAAVHDIGDTLAPFTHSEMIGAVLRPFVRPEVCWIAKHHGVFQDFYYAHFYDRDPNAREAYRGHQWFDACAEFCELYDQRSFDPEYETLPLNFFEPMIRRVFAEPRYLERAVAEV